jgi:serine phosphatase RsbU (regulator of sigma subunit)
VFLKSLNLKGFKSFAETASIDLEPGDVLLLYTDGVIEATNADHELFGEERLAELLHDSHQRSPQELIELIFQQVRLFSGSQHFSDDVSLIVMQVEEDKKSS